MPQCLPTSDISESAGSLFWTVAASWLLRPLGSQEPERRAHRSVLERRCRCHLRHLEDADHVTSPPQAGGLVERGTRAAGELTQHLATSLVSVKGCAMLQFAAMKRRF